MRPVLPVLVVTMGIAHAAPTWSEYGPGVPRRPAEQLVEAACDIDVEVAGAVAEVELQRRLTNPGPGALAAEDTLTLPVGAQLIGMTVRHGRGKAEIAVPVSAPVKSEKVAAERVLGADPALLTALPADDAGRPRFRVLLQPLAAEQDVTVSLRWTSLAAIRGGALEVTLPGHGDGTTQCHATARVRPGAGTSIERVLVDGTPTGSRGTATFDIAARDVTLSAVLAFARPQPVVWTQSTSLGDGVTAQAITIATPAVKSTSARRALLMIDGSRSMELVGRHNVQKLVRAIGTALPPKSEIEAVVFDRTPMRVLGGWKAPTPETLATIESTLSTRTAGNGSDTAAALAYAHQVIGDARGQTLVILVTDGVVGDLPSDALTKALASSPSELDVHVIALDAGRMSVPSSLALRAPVHYFGGSYVEVANGEVDNALASIDEWLRPAWQELALAGIESVSVPSQLRAGSGVVLLDIAKQPAKRKLKLTGHADAAFTVTAGTAPAAPLAQLALAAAGQGDESLRARLRERYPSIDDTHAFAVLTTSGSVAANRRAVVAGGGPYTRMIEVDDPALPVEQPVAPPIVIGGSAIDRNTITLLLRQYLQPASFTCYQRALATRPELAGTALFKLEIGRGELTRAEVSGLGDATFDACLVNAAYQVTPPLPNPDLNTDDRTIVNYPLTFNVREQKPFIIAGDADSSSPLDIDSIQGGPPTAKRQPVQAGDTRTPLGGLRPSQSP